MSRSQKKCRVPGTEYRVLFFFLAGTGTGNGYRVPGTVLSLAGTDPDTSFRYRVHFFPLRVPSTRFIKKKKKIRKLLIFFKCAAFPKFSKENLLEEN